MCRTDFVNTELAIRLSTIVHNRCPNAPHDIGIELAREVSLFLLGESGTIAAEAGRRLKEQFDPAEMRDKYWKEYLARKGK